MGDVSDIVRHITILKSNAEFKSVAQIRIDCHETVDLGGLGIHAAEFAATCDFRKAYFAPSDNLGTRS